MLGVAAVTVVFALLMIAAQEFGYRLYKALNKANAAISTEGLSLIVSSSVTIMGLLIAFSFGLAQERYELRRSLLVDEANAISTTFLRQQLLAKESFNELLPLMQKYAKLRREEASGDPGLQSWNANRPLQAQIWSATSRAIKTPEGRTIEVSLVQSTNAMFDAAENYRAAVEAKIPPRATSVLVIIVLGTCCMIGLALASMGSRQIQISVVMFLLLSMATTLVWDLDTSWTGGIVTPTGAMDRAVRQLLEGQPSR